jgi:hypothetical protein
MGEPLIWVDEHGNCGGYLTEDEAAEKLRQDVEAALAQAEQEERINP